MKIRSIIAGIALAISGGMLTAAPASADVYPNKVYNNCRVGTSYAYNEAFLVRDNIRGDRLLPSCKETHVYLGWYDVDYVYVPSNRWGKFWIPGATPKYIQGPRWVSVNAYSYYNVKIATGFTR